MFTVDVTGNVPRIGQQDYLSCGAATCQMTRDGYPNPSDRLFYNQSDLWNIIKAHNSGDPTDHAWNWSADPNGVVGCLNSLANPQGINWSHFAAADRNAALFSLLGSMKLSNFPTPVLVNQGQHWVTVVKYITDVEPTAGSTPTLSTIGYLNPEPQNVGSYTEISGASWFAYTWNGPVKYNGTWLGKYVVVVESTGGAGAGVEVALAEKAGGGPLTAEQAVDFASRYIDAPSAIHRHASGLFSHEESVSLEAALVQYGNPEGAAPGAPDYFIVPYGLKREADSRGVSPARGCVLVDAVSGEFQEATTFGKPVRYLRRDEALSIVAAALGQRPQDSSAVDARLMFQPSDISNVRAFPFWRIKTEKGVFYVEQTGTLHRTLAPSGPGR